MLEEPDRGFVRALKLLYPLRELLFSIHTDSNLHRTVAVLADKFN